MEWVSSCTKRKVRGDFPSLRCGSPLVGIPDKHSYGKPAEVSHDCRGRYFDSYDLPWNNTRGPVSSFEVRGQST